MKKKDLIDDLELFIDPTPLTKEEQVNLIAFIRKLKAKNKKQPVQKSVRNKLNRKPKHKLLVASKS